MLTEQTAQPHRASSYQASQGAWGTLDLLSWTIPGKGPEFRKSGWQDMGVSLAA